MEKQIRYANSIILQPDPSFWSKTSLIQLLYGFWINLTCLAVGLAFGFPAVTIPQLTSKESSIVVTKMEACWIASVLGLTCIVGCLFCGVLMDKYGRRIAIIACQIPVIVGWIFIMLSSKAQDIIIGRIISGIGCGMAMIVPRVYITEISLPNMRDVIGSITGLAFSLGIVIQATFGYYFHWRNVSAICSIYNTLLLVCNLWLPETPYFYLLTDDVDSAERSLKMFRAKNYNIEAEMEQLIEFKTDNNIRRLTSKEKFQALFTHSSCKPFSIVTMYMIILQCSGVSVVMMWTVDILERSLSSLDPDLGNIIIGLSRFLSAILVSILLIQVGKKPLALISGFGVGAACLAASIHSYYNNTETMYPLICYVIYTVSATLGYYTLPLLIMTELYPLQVRGVLGGISVSLLMILMFLTTFSYPHLRDLIGYRNVILAFGISSLLGCIYMFFCLPETKGLTLQEIEEYYNRRRPTLVSQRMIMSMQLSKTLNSTLNWEKSLENVNWKEMVKHINKSGDLILIRSKSKVDIANAENKNKKDKKSDKNQDEAGPSNIRNKNEATDRDQI